MITRTATTFLKQAALKPEIKLRPHQENAVADLEKKNGNLIYSHPVGSGKTISGIAGFERLREKGKATKALVVTPASLRENFAEKGVAKFTDDDYVIYGNRQEVASGQKKTVDPDKVKKTPTYGIVSYDMFRKDPEKYLKAHGADTVIFDEIHRIKNDASATFKALKDNRSKFKNFIGMTGSVVSNTPADVVPLIDAMTEGKHRLGSKTSFENRFLKIDPRTRKRELRNPIMVRSLIAPYVHHVTREQIESASGKPPKKKLTYVDVDMSPEQADLYRLAIDQLDPITKAKLQMNIGKLSEKELKGIFSKLMKSRQVANSLTGLYKDMPLEEAAEKTPKVRRLLDDVSKHIKKTPDAQVVIHSNLINSGLDVLEAGLKTRGISYGKFIGKGNKGVTEANRQKSVQDYNKGNIKALLISSAGGEGLDLPNTTMVASLDGHYNPERINQAEARGIRAGGLAHRPEKDRVVQVNRYRSILPRSISETAMNIWEAASPKTYLDRMMKNEEIWQDPFKRTPSVDEMIYQIAEAKDSANSQLRGQFDKTSSDRNPYRRPGYHSDAPILEKYYGNYGEKLLSGDYQDKWIDEHGERKYINKLRQYYNAMKQPNDKVVRLKKKDAKDWEKYDTEQKMRNRYLSKMMLSALPITAMSAAPNIARIIVDTGKNKISGVPNPILSATRSNLKGFLPAAYGGLLMGGVAALTSYGSSRKPHTITPKAEALRRSKMNDDELLKLLRGDVVATTKVKETEDYI